MSASDYLLQVESALPLGSEKAQIVGFLESQERVFEFDSHAMRYQARDPADDARPAGTGRHQILIYVDHDHRYSHTKVALLHDGP